MVGWIFSSLMATVEDRTWNGRGEPFQMPPLLLRNAGDGSFVDVSQDSGEYFKKNWLGRGVVNLDINADGLADLIISHQHAPAQILINKSEVPGLPRMTITGTQSNRNGFRCQIFALEYLEKTGKTLAFQEIFGGGSYLSAGSHHTLFVPSRADQIKVQWPSGKSNTISLKESTIVELVEY
jgi:enediyne biosynthesis protein E4